MSHGTQNVTNAMIRGVLDRVVQDAMNHGNNSILGAASIMGVSEALGRLFPLSPAPPRSPPPLAAPRRACPGLAGWGQGERSGGGEGADLALNGTGPTFSAAKYL